MNGKEVSKARDVVQAVGYLDGTSSRDISLTVRRKGTDEIVSLSIVPIFQDQ